MMPVPRKFAMNMSLKKPKILLIDVKKEYITDDLKTFI